MSTGVQQDRVDWSDWLRRWDAQQEGYVPEREARFTAMLDALAALLPASFVALDLACGPGSISQRLLGRFPEAHAIAVDIDPVMLALGRGALGTVDGRLRWVDVDLASPEWLDALGGTRVDAVLSSTALHWLPSEQLSRLYHDLARLLARHGDCRAPLILGVKEINRIALVRVEAVQFENAVADFLREQHFIRQRLMFARNPARERGIKHERRHL